jgi:hypothetical protein
MALPARRDASGSPNFVSALFHLYRERGRRQFWARARSEGGAYPMRYVTTERRGISPKVSRLRGLKCRGPMAALLVGRVELKLCSSSRLATRPATLQPRS